MNSPAAVALVSGLRLSLSLALIFACVAPVMAAEPVGQLKTLRAEYDAGQDDEAIRTAQNLLKKDPNNLTARYLLGNVLVRKNHLEEAKKHYQVCVEKGRARQAPESTLAAQALEQIRQRQISPGPGSTSGHHAPLSGTAGSSAQYLKEQISLLEKEKEEKIAVKRRMRDDKIIRIQSDANEQMTNLPRLSSRRVAQQEARNEARDQIEAEAKRLKEQIKSDFGREVSSLSEYYDKRIAALKEHYENVEGLGRQP
ncbi:MAG: tetratricopeptide repeat protein [Cyanobacteria bacterium SZAS TMP-1]|nr:tetratricopeptide repeat protein [Cyanobacteria bacterium SZAS TMP-1]